MNIKSSIILAAASLALAACSSPHKPEAHTLDVPAITPDYAGVTFAPNIAAPSFTINAEARAWQTEIGRCGAEPEIVVFSGSDGEVEIPLKRWQSLLESAKGDSIYFRFAAKSDDGTWNGAVADVVCPVSADPIDGYLVYRLLYPGYELWSSIGIYQRDLSNYDQRPVLENKDFERQCINCHNFSANNPEQGMMIHVRGKQGGTLISRNGDVEKINSNFEGANHGATYPAWSRDGRFIAFSANAVGQVFHSSGKKPIEVLDQSADMMVYDVDKHVAYSDSVLCDDAIATFPTWSPDSRTLYFCRAVLDRPDMPVTSPDSIFYNLCAIDFDPDNGRFSNFRTIYDAKSDSKSVTLPRVSPDGKWLMFTRMDYGTFSIWHPESQLCLLDLSTGLWREMDEVNSESIDSYHSWSSDGKWFVFSSKRLDGLWARPYFASFNSETGRATKPFALPQKDAGFYDTFTRTYNIPELITAPITNTDGLLNGITGQQPADIRLMLSGGSATAD